MTTTAPLAFVQARSTWSVLAPSRVAISFSGTSIGPLGSFVMGLPPHISQHVRELDTVSSLKGAVCLNNDVMFSSIL